MAKKESVKKSTGKKLTISNDSDNFIKIESENENKGAQNEKITDVKETTVVVPENTDVEIPADTKEESTNITPQNMEEMFKNELEKAVNNSEIINSIGIIDGINQSKEHIDELLKTTSPEELENTLRSELEKTNELEKKIEEQISEHEKKLTNSQKNFFDKKFSNYWNGWSSEF